MKTLYAKDSEVQRKWYVVDAKDQVLGRLAVKIAVYLRGKNKAIFTPSVDTGDFIVVVNADKIKFTGNKLDDKIYYWHTGYPGGIKSEAAKDKLKRKPESVIVDAVWGMLPKNRLGRQMIKKLKVYTGETHPHQAQKPEALTTRS